MTPYHYSVVRCRDATVRGEFRNVGLLVVSPTHRKAWLRRAALKQRAHLVGDDADFVKALLDLLVEEAHEVARGRDAALAHQWMKAKSRPTEDALFLTPPAVGIATDVEEEIRRLRGRYLGASGGGGSTLAEKLRTNVLRNLGIADAFVPREFPSGPATWRFASVTDLPSGPLVFNALQFGQKTPENVLDAAFRNVGRISELRHFHPEAACLTVAKGPEGGDVARAFTRAVQVMDEAGLNLVTPSEDAVRLALLQFGLGEQDHAAEA